MGVQLGGIMNPNSEEYLELAKTYLDVVGRITPKGTSYLLRIQQLCGAHAAVRAAVAFLLSKSEVDRIRRVPPREQLAPFVREYPSALELVEQMFQDYLSLFPLRPAV